MQVGAWLIPANFALPSISIEIDKNIVRRVLTKHKKRVSPEEPTLQLAYIERGIYLHCQRQSGEPEPSENIVEEGVGIVAR